jgi:hypothetical protein
MNRSKSFSGFPRPRNLSVQDESRHASTQAHAPRSPFEAQISAPFTQQLENTSRSYRRRSSSWTTSSSSSLSDSPSPSDDDGGAIADLSSKSDKSDVPGACTEPSVHTRGCEISLTSSCLMSSNHGPIGSPKEGRTGLDIEAQKPTDNDVGEPKEPEIKGVTLTKRQSPDIVSDSAPPGEVAYIYHISWTRLT